MFFTKSPAEKSLERAIIDDDSDGIVTALRNGADVNTQSNSGATPLMVAVSEHNINAITTLLAHGADPNLKDNQLDNAVTLATLAYGKSPKILQLVLAAGGDPNTKRRDGTPIIVNLLNQFDKNGAGLLLEHGADINTRNRKNDPIIMSYGLTQAWDNVLFLIEMGASTYYKNERMSWRKNFSLPHVVPPGSPLWPYKVKVWQHLKQAGMDVPQSIFELVDEDFYQYLDEKGVTYPTESELMGQGYVEYFQRNNLELKELPPEMLW